MTFSQSFVQYLTVLTGVMVFLHVDQVDADLFTIITKEEKTVQIEARLAGSGQNLHALELADGQLKIVPQAAVVKREVSEGPDRLNGKAVAEKLKKMFGEENIYTHVDKPFVIGYVVSGGRSQKNQSATRIKGFLKKAHRFFYSVQGTFLNYIRKVRIQASAPKYPLVVLIFETENGFEQYARFVTGNSGLSAQNMAGFYSPLTNYLTLRKSECESFDTPLHEAIHQQVYNRGIFQRLAPIPTWFNEGIATGFEGDGDRVRNGPMQISKRYAKLALRARAVNWKEVVRNDRAFRGDVFAGEAYGHAWGLHWLLLNKHKTKYLKYIQALSQKKPLTKESPDERLAELEEIVGEKIGDLQKEFLEVIPRQLRKRAAANRLGVGIELAVEASPSEFFLPLKNSSSEFLKIQLTPGMTYEAFPFGSHR